MHNMSNRISIHYFWKNSIFLLDIYLVLHWFISSECSNNFSRKHTTPSSGVETAHRPMRGDINMLDDSRVGVPVLSGSSANTLSTAPYFSHL